jgi:hypothetical protein
MTNTTIYDWANYHQHFHQCKDQDLLQVTVSCHNREIMVKTPITLPIWTPLTIPIGIQLVDPDKERTTITIGGLGMKKPPPYAVSLVKPTQEKIKWGCRGDLTQGLHLTILNPTLEEMILQPGTVIATLQPLVDLADIEDQLQTNVYNILNLFELPIPQMEYGHTPHEIEEDIFEANERLVLESLNRPTTE